MTGKSLREQRKQQRRQEILTAARKIFTEKGYHDATMEEIATCALLTRVSLYNYFPDKASLLQALLADIRENLAAALMAVLPEQPNATTRLQVLVRETLAFQREHRGILHVLLMASALPEQAEHRAFEQFIYLIAQIIEEGVQAGEFRSGPSLLRAEMLGGMFLMDFLRGYVPYKPEEHEEADEADVIIQTFLEGISI